MSNYQKQTLLKDYRYDYRRLNPNEIEFDTAILRLLSFYTPARLHKTLFHVIKNRQRVLMRDFDYDRAACYSVASICVEWYFNTDTSLDRGKHWNMETLRYLYDKHNVEAFCKRMKTAF